MSKTNTNSLTTAFSHAGTVVAVAFIGIGATTDTTAFQGIMDEVVHTGSGLSSWVLAVGATSLALLAAWNVGVLIRKHSRGEPGGSPGRTVVFLLAWLALGVTLFLVRWNGGGAPANGGGTDVHAGASFPVGNVSVNIDSGPDPSTQLHLTAIFFAAIYLVSGLCTMLEADRLYRPRYLRYLRCKHELAQQEELTAAAIAAATEADARVEQCRVEIELNDAYRAAAIGDRRAFGTELAHYTRVVMAIMMNDPARTNVTDTGPRPCPGWANLDDQQAGTA